MKLIEIRKDDLYVFKKAVSHVYYDDEYGGYYICMMNGKEYKIGENKDDVKKIINILNEEQ